MRVNLPTTAVEYLLPPGAALVSRTDLKGRITYVNPAFVEASGFSVEALMGKAHNIVRHPDMPPEAFADLWQTLDEGLPWTGVIKNRRANGDFYWVHASVTPIRRNGIDRGLHVGAQPTGARAGRGRRGAVSQDSRRHRSEARAAPRRRAAAGLGPAAGRAAPRCRCAAACGRATAVAALFTLAFGGAGWWSLSAAAGRRAPGRRSCAAFSVASALGWIGLGIFLDRTVFRPLDDALEVARTIASGVLVKFAIHPEDETKRLC